jgi:heme-degrading monooxygenase HmoA
MIAVFVTFRYESGFDAAVLREIAQDARARFEGMPGLRSKLFAVDSERREARNVYVWDSEEAARAFFSEETTHRVTGIYGVRPTVEFVAIAELVENAGR